MAANRRSGTQHQNPTPNNDELKISMGTCRHSRGYRVKIHSVCQHCRTTNLPALCCFQSLRASRAHFFSLVTLLHQTLCYRHNNAFVSIFFVRRLPLQRGCLCRKPPSQSGERRAAAGSLGLSLLSFTSANMLNLSAREGGESCPFAGGERRLLVGYEETRRRGEELETSGGGGEVGW